MELTVSETSIIDSVRLLAGRTRFGSKNPKERELKLRWSLLNFAPRTNKLAVIK